MSNLLYSIVYMCLLNLHAGWGIKTLLDRQHLHWKKKQTTKHKTSPCFLKSHTVSQTSRAILLAFCEELSLKSIRVLHRALLSDLALSINVTLKYSLKLNSELHEANRHGINIRAKHPFSHCNNCLVLSLLSIKGVAVSNAACCHGIWKYQAQPNYFTANTKSKYKYNHWLHRELLNPVAYQTSSMSRGISKYYWSPKSFTRYESFVA